MSSEHKPTPAVSKNRRQWPRKKPRSTAKVECRRGTLGLGPNLAVELLDICESGVGLMLKSAVNLDEEVEVVIRDFGQSKAIKQVARVCWCLPQPGDRFVVGLQFDTYVAYAAVQQVSKA